MQWMIIVAKHNIIEFKFDNQIQSVDLYELLHRFYIENNWTPATTTMCRNSCSNFCSWQLCIKALLIISYILFVIVVVPWLIVDTVKDGFKKEQLILIGGLFIIVAIPLCIWHILQHMLHFTKPILQRPIIRILWMVPIYSLNAVRIRTFEQ